jgi:Domain of unknown function (DUF1905)
MHHVRAPLKLVGINRCVDVPPRVSRALQGRAVEGRIEGVSIRTTVVPRGGGAYRLYVHSTVWRPPRTGTSPRVSGARSARWLAAAKRAETLERRIEAALDTLEERSKRKPSSRTNP